MNDEPSSSSDDAALSAEAERFMIFEGLVQWTQAVVIQSGRTSAAQAAQSLPETVRNHLARRLATLNFHAECHYFAIAADMFWEFRNRVKKLGLFSSVDFAEIDGFPWSHHTDVRNMRTHVTEYFAGKGRDRPRWFFDTPDFSADASSIVGTLIGGRLDWVALGAAAERLLPRLLREPIPYPTIPNMPPPPEPALPIRFLRGLSAMTNNDVAAAHCWMTSPNPDLGGAIPAEKTKTVEGLAEVVACIEARLASSRAPDAT
ncbi:MAG: MbcA/ParS/Xre antitoxin family protein [Roseiarcus sp.]